MELESHQKKLDRLARIRENQRKSRARRQEYIQELEQQLAVCKTQAHQQDIERRISIQKLEAENAKLRQLLAGLGVKPSSVDGYLHGHSNPAVTQKVAIPALRRTEMNALANNQENRSARSTCERNPTSQCRPNVDERTTEAVKSYQLLLNSSSPTEPGQEQPRQEHPHQETAEPKSSPGDEAVCGCLPGDEDSDPWPANETVLNTTLCAIAGELIRQYNTRGLDMMEIRNKLWAGFRKGMSAEEGCRVQNQVLFEVLDEISSNLS